MDTRHAVRLLIGTFFLLVVTCIPGCFGKDDYRAFLKSHDSIHLNMNLREVFDAGLADYQIRLGIKNVPGATLREKEPASKSCQRYVLDIHHFDSLYGGAGWNIRVYCNMNLPSAPQVIPERSYKDKQEFLQALDTVYASWASSMEFRVESPPRELFGIYDHYTFTTDHEGKVATVSPVNLSGSRQ
jgi:hypothetical protein